MRSSRRASRARLLDVCRLLTLCACLFAPAAAHAEFQIEGDVSDLRVVATQAQVEEIFSALTAIYGVTISAAMLPDQPVTGVYSGSLPRIVAQLLDRYDHVISVSPDRIEVAFIKARSGQGTLAQAAQSGKPRATVPRVPK